MRSIIKNQSVRTVDPAEGSNAPRAALPAKRAARHAKRVELLSVEGRVHALELTCSCGEVSLVEFEYPETPNPPRAS